MGKTDQQATRYFMKEFVQTGLGLSKLLEQQLWVGSCSLHLRFLVFSKKKKKKKSECFSQDIILLSAQVMYLFYAWNP